MGKPLTHLLVVSDLHCGSTHALCPPDFPLADDGYWGQTRRQAWIWDRWREFTAQALAGLKGKRWGLVLNGDLIEGVHHKTKEVIHYDTGVHVQCAIKCIKPLADRADAVFVTKGTPAHVGHTSELAIGGAIGAEPDPNADDSDDPPRAAGDWQIRVGPHLVSVWHHCSATSREWLESGEYSRAIAHEQMQARRAGHEVPTVIVRAHRHVPGTFQSPSGTMVVTPAWQLLTSFGRKVVPGARCFVGGAVLDLSGHLPHVTPWWVAEPPRKAYNANGEVVARRKGK